MRTSAEVLYVVIQSTSVQSQVVEADTDLASELGDDDGETVLSVPVLDVSNESLRVSAIDMQSHG